MPDKGRLLVEAERKREIDELRDCARPLGQHLRLGQHALLRGGEKCRGWRARSVAREFEPGRSLAGERIQVDDRDDPVGVALVAREFGGAEASVGSSVRRQEHERVGNGGRSDVARQLEECARARGVVIRARKIAEVVPVRHDHDCLLRSDDPFSARRRHRDEVHERLPPAAGNLRRELLSLYGEAVIQQLLSDPVRRVLGAIAPG